VTVLRFSTDRFPTLTRIRGRLRSLDEDLHHGQITWWIRLASWLLFAVPAWLIRPWLALPAVVLADVAWVVGLQWSWHRDRRRRAERRSPTSTWS
jgi:hypothetical protein